MKTHARISMKKIFVLVVLAVLVDILSYVAIFAQYQYYNPNDERFKFLALKKAEATLQERQQKFDNARALLEKGLISKEAFSEEERAFRLAQVEFQQAMLSVIFEKPHIIIQSAVKHITPDGRKRVQLTLVNTTAGSLDMGKLGLLDPDKQTSGLMDELDFGKLTNVYVSLKNEGSIVSQPYEQKIPEMIYGKLVVLDFGLLKDLDNLVVSFSYGDKVDEKQIMLMKDSKINPITINSMQFSQEANLGGSARYDLALEQYTFSNAAYQMMVINLPAQISYEFQSAESNLRISQIKFAEGITSRSLNLLLTLPDRADEMVKIDSTITFYAVAIDTAEAARLLNSKKGFMTAEEVASISGGKVRLELIPRGIGEIELIAKNLYYTMNTGDTLTYEVSVKNKGTAVLYNIKTELNLPYDWIGTVNPDIIGSLNPDQEQSISVSCFPSHEVGVGDYEVTLRTTSFANNRQIESGEKVVRVHISSRTSILGSLGLILVIVAAIVVIILFGLKISRR